MKHKIDLEASWLALLEDEFDKAYMQELKKFLVTERELGKKEIYWRL